VALGDSCCEASIGMDMFRLGADYLRGARSRLVDAESALRRGDYPEVVRYSQ
jgi:HEPN domain-containing protein